MFFSRGLNQMEAWVDLLPRAVAALDARVVARPHHPVPSSRPGYAMAWCLPSGKQIACTKGESLVRMAFVYPICWTSLILLGELGMSLAIRVMVRISIGYMYRTLRGSPSRGRPWKSLSGQRRIIHSGGSTGNPQNAKRNSKQAYVAQ